MQQKQPLPRNLCPANGTNAYENVPQAAVWILPWKSCQIFLELCANSAVWTCWNTTLECVPSCCLLLLTAQKSPLLSFSPSPNLLMKEWMTFSSFSSFNLTLIDFWGIPKSNGWNILRSRVEIKCSFKSHFLFFNSPHFNKDPLSHLFPKSLFLSNFTLNLLKSL